MCCLKKSPRPIKYGGKLLGSGYPRTENCTSPFSGPYLLCVHPEASELLLEELHEGFVEVIQGEGHYLIGLLPRDIGGQTCKRRRMNMSGNATNARGLHQTFISLEGSLTLCLVRGLLLSRA